MNHKTDNELLIDISEKLDSLIACYLIQGKERDVQIEILVNQGFSNNKISKFLAIPKGTVDGVRAKKKKIKKKS